MTSPGYDHYHGGGLSKEERDRLGGKHMSNGREKDQPFFDNVSEKIQNAYMAKWSAAADDPTLMRSWAEVGGIKATRHLYASNAGSVLSRPGATEFKFYNHYKFLVKDWKYIVDSAKHFDLDVDIFTAVLIYESRAWDAQTRAFGDFKAIIGNALSSKMGADGASVGISQLEIYKARWMLIKELGPKYANTNKYSAYAIGLAMQDHRTAIYLAAAWLAHLKEHVWYWKDEGAGTMVKHKLDDWEAALAYCGCSGVTIDPNTWKWSDPSTWKLEIEQFQNWMHSGKDSALGTTNADTAIKRRNYLWLILGPDSAVAEYRTCVHSAQCKK